ncbi:MAG: hypothetical protein J6B73_09430 [Methanobrevibacter sp.]|uniref:TPR repeat-containing protein n=1 Tax=Methanobrevibacter millerae TaxID=230361 RepID=A0A8T3VL41_9EURY|nr:hypothetical protein [Methanobrevibacter sp.]MBE6511317.1 hypothetical protein [Methanobrevibacter millerae]MBO5152363.1 hypothetical protein [Methanobrevibacter sp.]
MDDEFFRENYDFFDDENLLKRKISSEDEFQHCINHVRKLKRKRKWNSSKKVLEDFLESHPLSTDCDYEYHYFSKPIEKTIFLELFEPEKEIIILKDNFHDIFIDYASILLMFDEFSKAKSYLKFAHDLNPVNKSSLFMLANIFDNEYDGDLVEKTLKNVLNIAQDTYDLFQTYERLSKYYETIHEYEISNLLGELSKKKSFESFDKTYVKNLFNEYNIQLGFNPKIVKIFHENSVSAHFSGSDEYGAYYDYWELNEINLFFEED